MRMDHGAKADRVEMRKVRGIDMVRFPNPLPVASGLGNLTRLDKAPHIRIGFRILLSDDELYSPSIPVKETTTHSLVSSVLLLIINHKTDFNPPLPQVLSDWYSELAYDLTPDQAQGQLRTIFKHLNVVIPSISVSMAKPFRVPTNNQTLQPRVVDEKMEVSERKRLAFMVANTYKESKTLDPLLGTIDSVRNVKHAIEHYGFQVGPFLPIFCEYFHSRPNFTATCPLRR